MVNYPPVSKNIPPKVCPERVVSFTIFTMRLVKARQRWVSRGRNNIIN